MFAALTLGKRGSYNEYVGKLQSIIYHVSDGANKAEHLCAHFLTIKSATLFSFQTGTDVDRERSELQRSGVWPGSTEGFVLICPLGKILWGNIIDPAAAVSPCVHAWNWGWAL